MERAAHGVRPNKIDVYFHHWDIQKEITRRAHSYNIKNAPKLYPTKLEMEPDRRIDSVISAERMARDEQRRMETPAVLQLEPEMYIDSKPIRSDKLATQDYTASDQKQNQTMYQKQYCCNESKAVTATANVISNDRNVDDVSRSLFVDCNQTMTASMHNDHVCDTIGEAECNCGDTIAKRQASPSIVMTATIPASSHNVSMKQKNDHSQGETLSTLPKQCSHCDRAASMTPFPKPQNTLLSRLLFTDIIDAV